LAKSFDIVIIGGGVIGCMIARELSRFNLDIALVEKESDIGMGASSANSAIVHAGHDPVPGTLKAKMNVKANPMWDQLSEELNFPYDRRGAYIVAVGGEQCNELDTLLVRGKQNGVPVKTVSADRMRQLEPNINPRVSGALYTPTGGICDTFAVTIAAAENAVMNGVEILTNTAFEDFIIKNDRINGVNTNKGELNCRWVINAAGVYADVVMHKAGVRPEFNITPRRGEYFVLDRAEFTTNLVMFPVPTQTSKGILVTTTMHGNTIVGPNAQNIEDKADTAVTSDGMQEIWAGALNLIPSLNQRHIIASFSGLRAGGNAACTDIDIDYNHDFIIEVPTEVKGFVNLGGIESPGLTAAPAIAERVIELIQDAGEKLQEKKNWTPIRPARPRFRELSLAEQADLIRQDPHYGSVICRCEMVTEGEILAELRSPVPAQSYDAIKRRTWLGTGRCLGSFDMPRVVDILVKELGLSPFEVTKKGTNSEFLIRPTKKVEG